MERRRFVALGGTILIGFAGCLESESPVNDAEIASAEFEVVEGSLEMPEDSPSISFTPNSNQVVVDGVMEAGNPCTIAALKSVSYQPDMLTVTIGTQPTGDLLKRMLGCPDSLTIVDYIATITHKSTLPQTVTVTEIPAPSRDERTTTAERTV